MKSLTSLLDALGKEQRVVQAVTFSDRYVDLFDSFGRFARDLHPEAESDAVARYLSEHFWYEHSMFGDEASMHRRGARYALADLSENGRVIATTVYTPLMLILEAHDARADMGHMPTEVRAEARVPQEAKPQSTVQFYIGNRSHLIVHEGAEAVVRLMREAPLKPGTYSIKTVGERTVAYAPRSQTLKALQGLD